MCVRGTKECAVNLWLLLLNGNHCQPCRQVIQGQRYARTTFDSREDIKSDLDVSVEFIIVKIHRDKYTIDYEYEAFYSLSL